MAHRPDPLSLKPKANPRPITTAPVAVAPARPKVAFWAGMAALAMLQAAWLYWFLREPLPNAKNAGGALQRWLFLGRAFPHVIPDVTFAQSHLGGALDHLSHVENLPQRIPIVLAGLLIGGSAMALGRLLLRRLGLLDSMTRLERAAIGFAVGTSALGALTLVFGRLGLLTPWASRSGLFALILLETVTSRLVCGSWLPPWRGGGLLPGDQNPPIGNASIVHAEQAPREQSGSQLPHSGWSSGRWLALIAITGPVVVLMALAAMLPTPDFDAIEYHLQGPKEYYLNGRIAFLPHNVYTSMPFAVEMLHLLGMEVLDDWFLGALAGQLLVAGFAVATAAVVVACLLRWGSSRAAWFGAVAYLTTPWVYRLGAIPYVEGPLCLYHAGLVWGGLLAWDTVGKERPRFWGLTGLLAGGAMAIKYPALLTAVVPLGLVAVAATVRSRCLRPLLAFGIGSALMVSPWLIKNAIDTGNPVYPLAYKVFGGTNWTPEQDAKWSNGHASSLQGKQPITLAAFWTSVVDVAGRSDWQTSLFTALAPLALLRKGSRRFALVLWAYAAFLFLSWWFFTHRLDRFWLGLLPVLAMLAGLGADWDDSRTWRSLLGVVLFLSILTNISYMTTALCGYNEWTGSLPSVRRSLPEALNPALMRLDRDLPPGAKPLLVGQAAVFHLRRPVLYNTVFNVETIETLTKGKSPEQVRQGLRDLGVTHVYVDWHEIDRYKSPGNYGFSEHVNKALFESLVNDKILSSPERWGPEQEIYQVL